METELGQEFRLREAPLTPPLPRGDSCEHDMRYLRTLSEAAFTGCLVQPALTTQPTTKLNARGAILLLGGPSGSGKTAAVDMLISAWPSLFERPTSFTTRQRREDEGTEYIHVSQEEFASRDRSGDFVNSDIVYGNHYSISRDSIERILLNGKIAVKEVHPSNHHQFETMFDCPVVSVLIADSPLTDLPDERVTDDSSYYSTGIDPLQFHIIVHRRHGRLHETVNEIRLKVTRHLGWIDQSGENLDPRIVDRSNRNGYDAIASEFDDDLRITTRDFHSSSSRFFMQHIRELGPEDDVLEIGPGGGWLRSSFDWPAIHSYTGAEISPAMRVLPLGASEDIQLVDSLRNLPFADETFSAIFGSLCEGAWYPLVLCELHRVLKPGGRIIVSLPAEEWASATRKSDSLMHTTFSLADRREIKVYSLVRSPEAGSELLAHCGYKEVTITPGQAETGEWTATAPAIIQAAAQLEKPLSELRILDLVVAVRD